MTVFSHIVFYSCLFLSFHSFGQDWKEVITSDQNSDTVSIYRWETHDDYHSSFGEIILLSSGRFTYNSERPLNYHERSEGIYIFKQDTLILNSDFQNNSLPIKVHYSDTETQDRRLSFMNNLNNIALRKARYYLNGDTSINGIYYADFPLDAYPKDFLTNIKTLKVEVSPGIASQWVPIETNKKFIKVIVLSEKDFNEYQPKVLSNYKLLKTAKGLTDLDKDL